MITVVSWLWSGWRPIYRAEHVNRLQRMVLRNLDMPHRFICATDAPRGIECETVPIPQLLGFDRWPKSAPNCFRRLFLFSHQAKAWGHKFLSIDLDCIVTGKLDPLITEDPFKIMVGGVNPYNGSLWQVTPGWRPDLWSELDVDLARKAGKNTMPNGKRVFGSDQVVMAHKIPGAPTWGKCDGLHQYSGSGQVIHDNCRIMFYAGNVKPWDADNRFRDLYFHASDVV